MPDGQTAPGYPPQTLLLSLKCFSWGNFLWPIDVIKHVVMLKQHGHTFTFSAKWAQPVEHPLAAEGKTALEQVSTTVTKFTSYLVVRAFTSALHAMAILHTVYTVWKPLNNCIRMRTDPCTDGDHCYIPICLYLCTYVSCVVLFMPMCCVCSCVLYVDLLKIPFWIITSHWRACDILATWQNSRP